MSDHKLCPDCNQLLPSSEFYIRGGGYLNTYCKECSKERTRLRTASTVDDPHHSFITSESDVITALNRRGIPALPAKALSHRYGDVIAWGCVPIEVKSSRYINEQFSWGFTPRQRKSGVRGMIIILVCYWDDKPPDFHLFDAKNPWFYQNGNLKSGVGYKPVRSAAGRRRVLADGEFEASHNAWHLLEEKYNLVVSCLRTGSVMTDFLPSL